MIIGALLSLILGLLELIFGLLPGLPTFQLFTNLLTFFNNTICDGLKFFCFFVRPGTVVTALTISIAIFTFHHTYGFIMWVGKKIPFLNIK